MRERAVSRLQRRSVAYHPERLPRRASNTSFHRWAPRSARRFIRGRASARNPHIAASPGTPSAAGSYVSLPASPKPGSDEGRRLTSELVSSAGDSPSSAPTATVSSTLRSGPVSTGFTAIVGGSGRSVSASILPKRQRAIAMDLLFNRRSFLVRATAYNVRDNAALADAKTIDSCADRTSSIWKVDEPSSWGRRREFTALRDELPTQTPPLSLPASEKRQRNIRPARASACQARGNVGDFARWAGHE